MDKLFCKVTGKGKSVLLLHGIGASHRMWNEIVTLLPHTYQFVALDLLGFGMSPKPDIHYTIDEHIKAIKQTLKSESIHKLQTLVGHSLGSLLAIEYAYRFPKEVEKLILINPPIYKTSQEAKKTIRSSSPRVEYLLYSPLGRFYCGIHCTFHAFFSFALPFFVKKYPKAIIQDFLLHTWKSYKRTVTNVIENQHAYEALLTINIAMLILYGDNDKLINVQTLEELAQKNKNITLKKLSGQHDLPLVYPKLVEREIEKFLPSSYSSLPTAF